MLTLTYAPAVGPIHAINVNEAQINGEFERGESRIICSNDMMVVGPDGKRNKLKDHVFTAVDESPDDIGLTIFSPAFREQSFLARKTAYLRNCETLIGMKRGILSEVEAAERTAKVITSSEGDYNLTITDLQEMWETAAREAVRVCDILGQMYKQFADSVLVSNELFSLFHCIRIGTLVQVFTQKQKTFFAFETKRTASLYSLCRRKRDLFDGWRNNYEAGNLAGLDFR
ncbi:hypothetical protein [Oscillibacter sp.]|uniref:hypothetical protein n=1 Tax=Oscillibacter sp. TaxID=1945593 RepID=UPI0026107CC6|nr:hypothetical protein [Oscillibacter sp.]